MYVAAARMLAKMPAKQCWFGRDQDEPSHVPMDFTFEKVDDIAEMRKMIADEIRTYPFPGRTALNRSKYESNQTFRH